MFCDNSWRLEDVNYYHKALHLGCCNSFKSASEFYFWLIQTNSSRSFQDACTIVTGFSDFHIFVITVFTLYIPKQKPNIQTFRTFKRFWNNLFRSESDYELWKFDVRNLEFGLFYEFLTVQSIEKKLPETTIFSWSAVLGNISFTKITEKDNIYFFYQKYTLP